METLKARRKTKKARRRCQQHIRKMLVHHAGCCVCVDSYRLGLGWLDDARYLGIKVRVPRTYRGYLAS